MCFILFILIEIGNKNEFNDSLGSSGFFKCVRNLCWMFIVWEFIGC